MPEDNSPSLNETCVKMFGRTNPRYLAKYLAGDDTRNRPNLEGFVSAVKRFYGCPIPENACDQRTRDLSNRIESIENKNFAHVFPVVVPEDLTAFMVPVEVVPSDHWHVSDALGRLGFDNEVSNPREILMKLLMRLEQLYKRHNGAVLPLRWRRAYSIRLLAPIHVDAIDGTSLQAPLVLAVLRAFSSATNEPLPFGNTPVFMSGGYDRTTGRFLAVAHLKEKMRGFVREYGKGLPAIVSRCQYDSLQGTTLRDSFRIYQADDASELMGLQEMRGPLQRLCAGSPSAQEIAGFLVQSERAHSEVCFEDSETLAEWIDPHIESPTQKFELAFLLRRLAFHRGKFAEEAEHLSAMEEQCRRNPDHFGIHERIRLAALWGTFYFDACEPSRALPYLEEILPDLDNASLAERARYWGSYCQILRACDRLDESIDAGLKALRCAECGAPHEAGMDCNHLVHAFLSRARRAEPYLEDDLRQAEELLVKSEEIFAPPESGNSRRAHLQFCWFYRAEMARIAGKPHSPVTESTGQVCNWAHARLFELQASVRNLANSAAEREQALESLLQESRHWAETQGPIFRLLNCVYELMAGSLRGDNLDLSLVQLEEACRCFEQDGLRGWSSRLANPIQAVKSGRPDAVKLLCEAVPFH